ncbi:MAG: AsnC family transcriptional regulator [Desulfurococcales archaeon ex4484_42]|nr:MAG: AsnC family transcriptional regulator [Desulfurococcales archaeon ex4484_42]
MPELELDRIDRELLNLLQENAELTYAELGKRLGISPSTVYMRVKKLKEKGVIKRIVAEVNPEVLGYKLRSIIFVSIDVKKYNSVVEALSKIPQIKIIYDITGEWTFALEALVRDHQELSSLLDKIGNIDGVQHTSTAVVLRVIKEDKKVLPP